MGPGLSPNPTSSQHEALHQSCDHPEALGQSRDHPGPPLCLHQVRSQGLSAWLICQDQEGDPILPEHSGIHGACEAWGVPSHSSSGVTTGDGVLGSLPLGFLLVL